MKSKIFRWIKSLLTPASVLKVKDEDKVLTYDEYRKNVQLGTMVAKVKPCTLVKKNVPIQQNSKQIVDEVLYSITDGQYGIIKCDNGLEDSGILILA